MPDDPQWLIDLQAEESAEQEAAKAAEDAVDTAPETCCEYLLYAQIEMLGGIRWRIEHDYADQRPWAPSAEDFHKSYTELTEKLEAAVDQTPRFGVASPARSIDAGTANDSYREWFRGWDAWAKGLSDEDFHSLDTLLAAGRGAEIKVGMHIGTVLEG